MSKGASEITTMALYVGITMTAVSGALTVGAPTLENIQDANAVRQAQSMMQSIDSRIQEVSSEGIGSTRTVDISFDRGETYYQNQTNSLIYELQTDAGVISPQETKREGNTILSSSANVVVEETTIDGTECYLMENDRVKVCIKDIGSRNNQKDIDNSDLITHYEYKETGDTLDTNATVKLNGVDSSTTGTGYTEATETGEFIGTGEVKATISSDYGFTYDIFYRLPTGADFLNIEVQNYR